MWLSDPLIGAFMAKVKHLIDRGRSVEEMTRLGFQQGYSEGFTACARAGASYARFKRYYPETKTCPKCGHKWGGA